MTIATLPVPQKYDAQQWAHDPTSQTPSLYRGSQFNFSVISQYLQADADTLTVTLMGKTVEALNLQLETIDDPNYPIYFEVQGRTYDYVFSFWADRTTIDVHRHMGKEDLLHDTLLSILFPSTEAELRQALSTIASDLA